MPIDTLYYLAGLTIEGAAAANEGELRVVEQLDAPLNQQFFDVFQESHPEPTTSTIMAIKPELTFRTHAWEALNLCGYAGLASQADEPRTGTLYFRTAANLGTRVSRDDESHLRFQVHDFLMYITSLRLPYQQPAMADVRLKPAWDGTTAPFLYGGVDAALPFTTTPFNRLYTLSMIKFATTVIDQHSDVTINFNQQVAELGADDDIYDSTAVINSIRPEILLSGYDFTRFNYFTEAGPGSVGTVTLFLRRKKENGTYYANNSANHIKIVMTANHWVAEKVSGGMNAPGMISTRLRPLAYDVETPCMEISFDQTIA
jgi:hypothetical protein